MLTGTGVGSNFRFVVHLELNPPPIYLKLNRSYSYRLQPGPYQRADILDMSGCNRRLQTTSR